MILEGLRDITRVDVDDPDARRRTENYIRFCIVGAVVSTPAYVLALVSKNALEVALSLGITTGVIATFMVGIALARRGFTDWIASFNGLLGAAFFIGWSYASGTYNDLIYFPIAFSLAPLSVVGRRAFVIYVTLLVSMYALRIGADPPQDIAVLTVVTAATLFGASMALVTIQNFTTRTYLERSLDAQRIAQERLAALEEASRGRDIFLANITHELRTPLNAIIGYAELLDEELEDDEVGIDRDSVRTDLSKIGRSGSHLKQLIDDLLDLSRLRAGEVPIQPVDFGVRAVLVEAEQAARAIARAQDTEIELALADGLESFSSDRRLVLQILHNLVGNAVKFTREGTVRISASIDEEALVLEVRDDGIGMTEEELGRVRAEFAQASIEVSREYGGTGLGLSIIERLVDALGGSFTLESEKGQGTTATVILPQLLSTGSE